MMSSEEYEVLYTVRTELAKKGLTPGVFDAPSRFGSGGCGGSGGFGPWGYRPFGPGFRGPGGCGPGNHEGSPSWMKDVTPAEMGVLMESRDKTRQRATIGGILGASTMAGVGKVAAMGGFLGFAGIIVGGAIGARVAVRTSGIRQEMMARLLKLPSERSPRASEAREILRTKLPNNTFAQELLKESGTPSAQ